MTKLVLAIFVFVCLFQGLQVTAQEPPPAHEVVAGIGIWGSIPLIISGAIAAGVDPSSASFQAEPVSLSAYIIPSTITGLTAGLLGLVGYDDWGLWATVAGGIASGGLLTWPIITAVLIPVAYIIDTIFFYGPFTGYSVSLANVLIGSLDEIFAYYSIPEIWIAAIPSTVWLLGLGITSLLLKDSNVSSSNTGSETIQDLSISPVFQPGRVGFIASFSLP